MEETILQSCKNVEQSLELHFKEGKTNADFWACKGLLRAAVAAHTTKIEPMVREFKAAGAASAVEQVNEINAAYISLLVRIAQAALRIGDKAIADEYLKNALATAAGLPQEAHVRQVMQESAEQTKRTSRRPWG